jgi:hypothetical protein
MTCMLAALAPPKSRRRRTRHSGAAPGFVHWIVVAFATTTLVAAVAPMRQGTRRKRGSGPLAERAIDKALAKKKRLQRPE